MEVKSYLVFLSNEVKTKDVLMDPFEGIPKIRLLSLQSRVERDMGGGWSFVP